NSSTNGLAEYTASNFGGKMKGDLLAASYNNSISRIKLDASGAQAELVQALFNTVGSTPLDVTAIGDDGPFPGTIWVADIFAHSIIVFEPGDYDSSGGGPVDPNDFDGDGYSNDDEIANGTDPYSSA